MSDLSEVVSVVHDHNKKLRADLEDWQEKAIGGVRGDLDVVIQRVNALAQRYAGIQGTNAYRYNAMGQHGQLLCTNKSELQVAVTGD